MTYKNKRLFSSLTKNVNTLCINNNTYYLFTDLNNKYGFIRDLYYILNSVVKSDKSYEICYYLYLWTNNDNKNLLYILSKISVSSDDYTSEFTKQITGLLILEKTFKHRGYYNCVTDIYNPKLYEYIDQYILNIYTRLGEYVISTNENLLVDEFIEFKRDTVLTIKVLDGNYKS